ncbi:hypothetical protein RRG08_033849 [Elysia crispata]|uniref:Uncharacterized protein n=1 Tax=Elysia crispata TaxID=231223 RepID=A0AAE1EC89_9GAST|nr:hypothetical protein RRG08_033849 [Elysia crispata]
MGINNDSSFIIDNPECQFHRALNTIRQRSRMTRMLAEDGNSCAKVRGLDDTSSQLMSVLAIRDHTFPQRSEVLHSDGLES